MVTKSSASRETNDRHQQKQRFHSRLDPMDAAKYQNISSAAWPTCAAFFAYWKGEDLLRTPIGNEKPSNWTM